MSGELVLLSGNMKTVEVNRKEALRYLGVRGEPAPELSALLDRARETLNGAAAPRAVCRRLPLRVEGELLDFGVFRLQSRALAKNMAGCGESFLFAATLGFGPERLLLRLQKSEPSFALVFDAWCSAAVEGWCNEVNARLAQNETLRPRFSPGYGDVPLSLQRDVLAALDAQRKLGITLSDTFFMTPCKSVTAFVGISGS
ncbi:MAG: Vitamin B12 dependent methionine synthase activation subunit [Clostridia bacterium]|nr:Vitamin B12 dependent methionine synthase activation subunit [Clostridia bacterium]